ncbi:effector-associated constant component EACC1 [Nocardia sp. NPDC003963]
MTDHSITFSFADTDASEADALASDLTDSLREQLPQVSVTRTRTNKQNQDFGATVVAIAGAPFMITLASGIAKWLARRSDAKLHMRRMGVDGQEIEVSVNGRLGAQQTKKLIEEFFAD